MPAKDINTSRPGLDVKEILRELEVPFSPDQVQWRVTVTANDRKRGQIVPYADPRAYTDRLNALLSPQGWTREYRLETMSNITRIKKGKAFSRAKCSSLARSLLSACCRNPERVKLGLTTITE